MSALLLSQSGIACCVLLANAEPETRWSIMKFKMKRLILCLALLAPLTISAAEPIATPASSYQSLATLFTDWRAFNHPAIDKGRPDYSAAAMTKKAEGLAAFRARLKAIDFSGWSTEQKNDYRIVEAEMNGF